ncbi:MAG: hypothetical protein OIN88_17050, partial [Candidatus Methanoperedens sp.]|nr:hypothetical protein [Candidatus Methanoperedens sp.]
HAAGPPAACMGMRLRMTKIRFVSYPTLAAATNSSLLAKDIKQKIHEIFGDALLNTTIPRSIKLAEAPVPQRKSPSLKLQSSQTKKLKKWIWSKRCSVLIIPQRRCGGASGQPGRLTAIG